MTTIIGLVHEDKVYMGADSQVTTGWRTQSAKNPKIYSRGTQPEFIMGVAGGSRFANLLFNVIQPPIKETSQSPMEWMVSYANSIQEAFETHKVKVDKGNEYDCHILVGFSAQLFTIDCTLGVTEHSDPFVSIGSGADIALGALVALAETLPPKDRILRALEIAERFNMGTSGPFHIEVK